MISFRRHPHATHCSFCQLPSDAVGALVVDDPSKSSICDGCARIAVSLASETLKKDRLAQLDTDVWKSVRLGRLTNADLVQRMLDSDLLTSPDWVLVHEMMTRLDPRWADEEVRLPAESATGDVPVVAAATDAAPAQSESGTESHTATHPLHQSAPGDRGSAE